MKSLILSTFLMLIALVANTQTEQDEITLRSLHKKGDQILNAGVGFLNAGNTSFALLGGSSSSGSPSPSLNISYDYGLTDQLSIGAFTNFYRVEKQNTVSLTQLESLIDDINEDPLCALQCATGLGFSDGCICSTEIEQRVSVISFGGKLSLRRSLIPELDTYVSTYLGYSWNRQKTITESALDGILNATNSSIEVPSIIYFGVVGARYFVSETFAVYGEFGYGNVHLIQLGCSYRIR